MNRSPGRREAAAAVPYPLQVAAAVSWRLLAVAGMIVVVGYVVITLRVVVIPVAVALLLTALLGPVVDWLTRHRVPRGLATLVVLVAGLSAIGGLLAFVIQAFVAGLPALQTQFVASIQQVRVWLLDPPFGLPAVNLQSLFDSLGRAIANNRQAITSGALTTALTVGQYLAGAALALFTLIYFLYGGRSMWRFLLHAVPRSVRHRVDLAGRRGFNSLVGFIRATVLVAVVDAVGIGIGLFVVGAPLVVPLAALTFLAAFIPVIGAVIAGVIAVLIVLVAKGWVAALIVLGVVIGVQQLEGNVLQPLLMGRAVELNGIAVVLAVAVGSVYAGIAGALLSVPLLAVLNAGIRGLVSGEAEPDDSESAGSSFPPADVSTDPDPVHPDPGDDHPPSDPSSDNRSADNRSADNQPPGNHLSPPHLSNNHAPNDHVAHDQSPNNQPPGVDKSSGPPQADRGADGG